MLEDIETLGPRIDARLRERQSEIFRQTDRLFGWLMVVQWPAAIAAAVWISPRTWIGATGYIHLHVWAAIILGAVIASAPAYFAFLRPGETVGRHVIAAGQMLMGALLIDLTGGRIETHFHVFGSLAFLAFYRDWRVLVTASAVVAVDHFIRGVWWPGTVFGVFVSSHWRWLEHAAWVVFEDVFLIRSCQRGVEELRTIVERQIQLEATNDRIEATVQERTLELEEVNARLEEEVSERRRVDEELRFSALHDALTGLPNRTHLLERLNQSIRRMQREEAYRIGLLFIDLDNFKIVNDSLGHDAGDELLVEAARRIGASLRDTDCVARSCGDLTARLGGDEFVVLLDGIRASEDAVRVCERLLQELGNPLHLRGTDIKLGASIGIALGQAVQEAADLIRDADTAMYRAKSAGKAGYAVFDATMHTHVRERLQFENDLRRAIEANQLSVVYQPIIDLNTARAVAFESLVRWQHPEKGLISPAAFVPIAEETGLIVPLGEWVLTESLHQLERWNRNLAPPDQLSMNVNVSRRQLLDPRFVSRLQTLLSGLTVTPDRVHLEITESSIVSAPEKTRDVLDRLVELGIELHLDDFGTGLSSLSCLRDFPLVALKIDRSFIQGSEVGRTYAAILHAIVNLSHNLGLRVVAEGVESEEQLAAVIALDCDFVQGYLFSRPVPADQAQRLIGVEFTRCAQKGLVAGTA